MMTYPRAIITNAFPMLEFIIRERLKEGGKDFQFAAQCARLALAMLASHRNQSNHRFRAAGDDDFLTAASLLDQAGEVGFGLVDSDRSH